MKNLEELLAEKSEIGEALADAINEDNNKLKRKLTERLRAVDKLIETETKQNAPKFYI